MTGWLFIVAGVVLAVVGAFVLVGPWALVAGGALMVVAGLVLDFEREEPKRGKRSQSAP